jgi:hypothetical protein
MYNIIVVTPFMILKSFSTRLFNFEVGIQYLLETTHKIIF